jgi:hypothetical protein
MPETALTSLEIHGHTAHCILASLTLTNETFSVTNPRSALSALEPRVNGFGFGFGFDLGLEGIFEILGYSTSAQQFYSNMPLWEFSNWDG